MTEVAADGPLMIIGDEHWNAPERRSGMQSEAMNCNLYLIKFTRVGIKNESGSSGWAGKLNHEVRNQEN